MDFIETSTALPGVRRVEQIMGMPIGIDVRDADVRPTAIDEVFSWFRWVDDIFSPYKAESEISLLNRGELTLAEAHPDVRAVLARCDELRLQTQGYFDIRTDHLPEPVVRATGLVTSSGIDPSGLVKGWSVDCAADLLIAAGARNFAVNAGGDIRVMGAALPDDAWRVGIQHPLELDRVAAVVVANCLAIATSGTYRRGEHIVDPHTGEAPPGLLSVTITGADLGTADAYATAAYAMGVDGPAWTAGLFGYEAMSITDDGQVLSTRWFPLEPPD